MIAPDKPPAGFYVYLLVDPRDDKPFYAGKGQRWRAWQHERDVRAGKPGANPAKVQRIQGIIDAGLSVTIAIVAVFDLESEALNHEFKLVDASPDLVNAVPGGNGQGLSAMASARTARARRLRLERLRLKERKEAALADAQARRADMLAKGRDDAERSEIERWMNGLQGQKAQRLLAPQVVKLKSAFQDKPTESRAKRRRAARKANRARRRELETAS